MRGGGKGDTFHFQSRQSCWAQGQYCPKKIHILPPSLRHWSEAYKDVLGGSYAHAHVHVLNQLCNDVLHVSHMNHVQVINEQLKSMLEAAFTSPLQCCY